ncbi:tubulin/FtsZ family protein [Natronomonas gomsonensis]|jgi:cell division GTPase FtsZ|uniref:tubulin/FtsZ family protein n=1 Tax=Natronomonas gomsonensis TaxID=1046043 RepID=UPI0020CA30F3|nr:tubulin/FtsZ family protein [Natronomonas gomsonensis]MCY4729794.1 tubulin/FtsZ family protein [Natronomonas gomsonensis]
MKLAVIGFGQAGGKVLDRLLEYDLERGTGVVSHAIAVNSAKTDLMSLECVPEENRVLIGQTVVDGHGAGTEPSLGRQCAEADLQRIQTALDGATSEVDAFLVVAGLGGGTGSGGSPVLADHLREIYTKPVYGLGILPAESEGGIYNRNAADSLERFVDSVDNLLLFDNDAFKATGESLAEGYTAINDEIVTRFGSLFSAGELDALGDTIAESVVDASEIINTLGDRGITSVGYAAEELTAEQSGLLDRLKADDEDIASEGDAAGRITSLVRRATLGKLTVPCGLESTKRALLVVSGPPEQLNRNGIEEARSWLEERTGCLEVRTGDYPRPDADSVAAVVVFSGVTDIPRIDDVQAEAIRTEEFIWNTEREGTEDELEELVSYDNESKSSALLD